jgi:hypothetical protein
VSWFWLGAMTAKPRDLNPDRPIIGVAVLAEENLRQNRSAKRGAPNSLRSRKFPDQSDDGIVSMIGEEAS